jgi:hypothetical protein
MILPNQSLGSNRGIPATHLSYGQVKANRFALGEALRSIGKYGPGPGAIRRQKSLDCDKVVKAGVRFGINSAWAGCLRALCGRINCKYYDDCGGISPFEHDQRAGYYCGWRAD